MTGHASRRTIIVEFDNCERQPSRDGVQQPIRRPAIRHARTQRLPVRRPRRRALETERYHGEGRRDQLAQVVDDLPLAQAERDGRQRDRRHAVVRGAEFEACGAGQ